MGEGRGARPSALDRTLLASSVAVPFGVVPPDQPVIGTNVASARTLDITAVVVSPTFGEDRTLLAVVDGRLARKSDDGGFTPAAGLGTDQVTGMAFAPSDPGVVYASTADGVVYRSDDAGRAFEPTADIVPGIEPLSLAVASDEPDIALVVGASGDLFRTLDGGASWIPVPGLGSVSAIASSQQGPDRLYAANTDGNFYISDDGAASWLAVNGVSDAEITTIGSLGPDPSVVLVGDVTGAVWRSTNSGRGFRSIGSDELPDTPVRDAQTVPLASGESTIWIAYADQVFRSDDRGATFTSTAPVLDDPVATESGGLGPFGLGVDADESGVLFLAGSDDVYQFAFDSAQWMPLTLTTESVEPTDDPPASDPASATSTSTSTSTSVGPASEPVTSTATSAPTATATESSVVATTAVSEVNVSTTSAGVSDAQIWGVTIASCLVCLVALVGSARFHRRR